MSYLTKFITIEPLSYVIHRHLILL